MYAPDAKRKPNESKGPIRKRVAAMPSKLGIESGSKFSKGSGNKSIGRGHEKKGLKKWGRKEKWELRKKKGENSTKSSPDAGRKGRSGEREFIQSLRGKEGSLVKEYENMKLVSNAVAVKKT